MAHTYVASAPTLYEGIQSYIDPHTLKKNTFKCQIIIEQYTGSMYLGNADGGGSQKGTFQVHCAVTLNEAKIGHLRQPFRKGSRCN